MPNYTHDIIPNTFVVGAQKSATTSIYDWVAQHPQACGPLSLKDAPIFFNSTDIETSLSSAQPEYLASGFQNDTKVVLQGWVQYMYYPDALINIRTNSPTAKLIVVLRNPIDRAISAYRFFKKLGREHLSFREALDCEPERQNGTFEERNDLTYVDHGLYVSQLKELFKIFESQNVFITFFDDVQERPHTVVADLYKFLDLNSDFKPDFSAQNITGIQRFPWLDRALSRPSPARRLIVKYLVDPIFPLHRRTQLRWKLRSWNTILPTNESSDEFAIEREILRRRFYREILDLENLLGVSLENWKQ